MSIPEKALTQISIPKEVDLIRSICSRSYYRFVQEFWHLAVAEKPVWNWHCEYLCQKLQDMFEDVEAGRPKKYDLIINLPPGSSKCCVAGTHVLTPDGLVNVEDLRCGDYVMSVSDFHILTRRRIKCAGTYPKTPCVAIDVTGNIESLAVSRNHPVAVKGEPRWKNAGDLALNDELLTLQNGGIVSSAIDSITDIGEHAVYHIQVDADQYDDQNYIANNVVVHNSTLFSILFPAFVWCRMPTCRFITASFNMGLAQDFARKSKMIIQSDLYRKCFGHFQFLPERVGHYMNQYKGERVSCTTGTSPTGRHAHFILIDDPIDPLGQDREVAIHNVNTWMQRVVRSRTVDAMVTPLILVMQRLSVDDPTGEWLSKAENSETKIFHISLPASIESGQSVCPPGLKHYYVNNLFDPVRLPYTVLHDRKLWMGSADYSAQYDQEPLPKEGLMFAVQNLHIKTIDELDPVVARVRYWDKAISTKVDACYTVGTLMGRTKSGKFVVMDVQRGQWDAATRESIILQVAKADGPNTIIGIEQEPGSGGIESALYTVNNLAGFNVCVDRASQAKDARAEPFAIQVKYGNVFMLDGNWNTNFLSEVGSFPRGRYKDQVDSAVGAFKILCGSINRTAGAL